MAFTLALDGDEPVRVDLGLFFWLEQLRCLVRLDLNLEKGRIREETVSQELKIKETETKIEQELAALREKLEQVKIQTLQWLMGVCTGFAALMLGAWRLLM